jgi:hypothetical protein
MVLVPVLALAKQLLVLTFLLMAALPIHGARAVPAMYLPPALNAAIFVSEVPLLVALALITLPLSSL